MLPTRCSAIWLRSAWQRVEVLSGRKQQGKCLLLAVVGEAPWASSTRQLFFLPLACKAVPAADARSLLLLLPHSSIKGVAKLGVLFTRLGLTMLHVCRWFKFEEDVEDGSERWSKPYVGTLPLPSLLELKSFITNGMVLLDISASSMEEIAGTVGSVSLWQRPQSACCGALHSPLKACPSGRTLPTSAAVCKVWLSCRADVQPSHQICPRGRDPSGSHLWA